MMYTYEASRNQEKPMCGEGGEPCSVLQAVSLCNWILNIRASDRGQMRNGQDQAPDRLVRGTHERGNGGYKAVSVSEAEAGPGWVSGQLAPPRGWGPTAAIQTGSWCQQGPYVDGSTAARPVEGGSQALGPGKPVLPQLQRNGVLT